MIRLVSVETKRHRRFDQRKHPPLCSLVRGTTYQQQRDGQENVHWDHS